MKLEELTIFPIKSCGGIELSECEVQERGLEFDRRWMIVDESGVGLTQREVPALAAIRTSLGTSNLELQHRNTQIGVPLALLNAPQRKVRVWNDDVEALDDGDEVADWLQKVLDRVVRLVQMPEDARRRVDPKYASNDEITSFSDGFPFLLLSQSSLDDLNDRILEKGGEPVEVKRFRSNFVVSGARAWDEDEWARIRIGDCEFEAVKPCTRCVITTLDQNSGEKTGAEPLRTLATFRKRGNGVVFAQNLLPRRLGRVRVGDEVEVLSRR